MLLQLLIAETTTAAPKISVTSPVKRRNPQHLALNLANMADSALWDP